MRSHILSQFHRLLHRALSQAVKWQFLARNPVDAVEPPRPQRQEMNVINEAVTALLLDKMTRKEHSCSIDVEETCYPNPSNIDTLLRHWSQMQ